MAGISFARSTIGEFNKYNSLLVGNDFTPPGPVPGTYFFGLLGAGAQDFGRGIKVDSNDNLVLAPGRTDEGIGTYGIPAVSISPSGTINWQRVLSSDNTDSRLAQDNILDSSNSSIYVGVNGTSNIIFKYNSSGSLIFQKTTNTNTYLSGVDLDASENIYIAGRIEPRSTSPGLVMKLNSSAVIQWQKSIIDNGGGLVRSSFTDNSGNTFACFQNQGNALLVKFDSGGNLIWQRELGSTYTGGYAQHSWGLTVDASGNIYIQVRDTLNFATEHLAVIKINSSGSIVWSKKFDNGSGGLVVAYNVKTDSVGNIYATGFALDESLDKGYIVKFDPSGNVLWQRYLFSSEGSSNVFEIDLNSSGDICLIGDQTTTSKGTQARLGLIPADGSLTGTYSVGGVPITYENANFTFESGLYTSAAGSGTVSTPTLTISNAALTDQALNFTIANTVL